MLQLRGVCLLARWSPRLGSCAPDPVAAPRGFAPDGGCAPALTVAVPRLRARLRSLAVVSIPADLSLVAVPQAR